MVRSRRGGSPGGRPVAFFMRAPTMDEAWAPQTLAPMGSGASASEKDATEP